MKLEPTPQKTLLDLGTGYNPPESLNQPRPVAKPGSASACHAIALLGLIAGIGLAAISAMSRPADPVGVYIGAACAVSSVFWWALGDIVIAVSAKR